MTELLPNPADVLCELAVDVRLQLHTAVAMTEAKIGTDDMVREVSSLRDTVLANRLRNALPNDDLVAAQDDQGALNFNLLRTRVPSTYAMYVMISALTAHDAIRAIEASNIDGE